MSLYAYQIKVKLRRLNPHLCVLESLRSAQWSPCVWLRNRNSSCYLRPCPLPLLASGWGGRRAVSVSTMDTSVYLGSRMCLWGNLGAASSEASPLVS